MLKFFKTLGSRLLSGVRLSLAAVLLLPLPLFMVYNNYTIDRQGYFQGNQYLRDVVSMLMDGQDITGYELLTSSQRDILKVLTVQLDPTPTTVAFGSSRILQLNQEIARDDNFFNLGVTGGDAADVLGGFYLFDRENRLPSTVIIGFDPWLLRDSEEFAFDGRSDKELYTEFLNAKLGYSIGGITPANDDQQWEALYSMSYFQGNVAYYLSNETSEGDKPQAVRGDVMSQSTEVKRSDGSLVYAKEFRERDQVDIDKDAQEICGALLRMEDDYTKLDSGMLEVFDRFFAYAQSRGITVKLVLTPYHPIVYQYVLDNAEHYGGFLQTEPAIRKLAAKYGIEVYGSYDPGAIDGVTEADFYDGLHCTGNCLEKILWGAS